MDEVYRFKRKKTFRSLFLLYFMVFFYTGILPVNIDSLLISLAGATTLGIGITVASTLITGTMSIFVFGYFGDKITEKYSRKRIFMYTNILWITAYGLSSLSFNYIFYSTCLIVGAIGTGAFLPIGFSIIGVGIIDAADSLIRSLMAFQLWFRLWTENQIRGIDDESTVRI